MNPSDTPSFVRLLDRLLPARVAERPSDERTRARGLVMSSVGVTLLGAFSLLASSLSVPEVPYGAALATLGFATVPLLYRATGSYRGAAWLFVLLAMAFAMVALPRSGGLDSVYVLGLPMLPAVVLVVLDYRAAVTSVFFVLGLAVVLAHAQTTGMLPPARPPSPGQVAWVVVFTSIFFLAVSYARERALEDSQLRQDEQERARARAEAASRAKSAILASVSHELRTPMTGILGLSDLLADTDLDPKQREWVRTVHKTGTALLALLDDLLDTARLDAGRITLDEKPFRPVALAEQVLALFRPKARARRLSLELDVGPGVPLKVLGDPARVRQVLTNLVGNAVKFTHEGGVTLRVAQDAGALVFEVIDTGVGVAPDRLDDIFAPFVQGEGTSDEGGVGLGLSIARLLVDAMQGTLGVRSTPGAGSTFRVRLPLEILDEDTPTTESMVSSRSSQSLRVLVAEDNAVNRMVLTAMLESLGHKVKVAHDGTEVLPLARRFEPDVVLMDMRMPVMDGLEATRRLRADATFEDVRVIALTANAHEEDRRACLAAGMDAFLAKPVTRAQLHVALTGGSLSDLLVAKTG